MLKRIYFTCIFFAIFSTPTFAETTISDAQFADELNELSDTTGSPQWHCLSSNEPPLIGWSHFGKKHPERTSDQNSIFLNVEENNIRKMFVGMSQMDFDSIKRVDYILTELFYDEQPTCILATYSHTESASPDQRKYYNETEFWILHMAISPNMEWREPLFQKEILDRPFSYKK